MPAPTSPAPPPPPRPASCPFQVPEHQPLPRTLEADLGLLSFLAKWAVRGATQSSSLGRTSFSRAFQGCPPRPEAAALLHRALGKPSSWLAPRALQARCGRCRHIGNGNHELLQFPESLTCPGSSAVWHTISDSLFSWATQTDPLVAPECSVSSRAQK